MGVQDIRSCTAFKSNQRISSGNLLKVAGNVKEILDQDEKASILIFDDDTSELVEVDFRGSVEEVLKRMAALPSQEGESCEPSNKHESPRPGPGRPKLGVVSREVTLLPRHWDWLSTQPGGASVALRKLVDEARRANSSKDKVRRAQEVTYRFISAMAGDFQGFEEASRALFAGNPERFNDMIASWPTDVREHARKLSIPAFENRE